MYLSFSDTVKRNLETDLIGFRFESQYQLPYVYVPTGDGGLSLAEIVITVVCTVALVFVAGAYLANKYELMACLNEISNEIFEKITSQTFTLTLLILDITSDWLNFFLTINKSDDVMYEYVYSYLVVLTVSSIVSA